VFLEEGDARDIRGAAAELFVPSVHSKPLVPFQTPSVA
jgi:hypothetical protein